MEYALVTLIVVVSLGLSYYGGVLMNARCPRCGSKFRCELLGEWGDQHWTCHGCKRTWFVPYEK